MACKKTVSYLSPLKKGPKSFQGGGVVNCKLAGYRYQWQIRDKISVATFGGGGDLKADRKGTVVIREGDDESHYLSLGLWGWIGKPVFPQRLHCKKNPYISQT